METVSSNEVTEPHFTVFVNISVHLTGFGKNELLATGMAVTYYYTIMKEPDYETVNLFFIQCNKILTQSKNPRALLSAIEHDLIPPSNYDGLAKRIILMWYSGVWTQHPLDKKIKTNAFVISPQSYAQGLIWSAAKTHPAGAKQPGFGSWSIKPLNEK